MNFLCGFLLGVIALLSSMVWRMRRSDGWDKSNALNAIRLIWHVIMHPEDFGKLYYLPEEAYNYLRFGHDYQPKQPFWYIDKDEFSEVVDSRFEDMWDEEED